MPRRARPLLTLRAAVADLGSSATPDALQRLGYTARAIRQAVEAGELRYRPDGVLEPAPRMGRPPRAGEAASVKATLRFTPGERDEIKAAAARDGVTHWVRWVADRALEAARKQLLTRFVSDGRNVI